MNKMPTSCPSNTTGLQIEKFFDTNIFEDSIDSIVSMIAVEDGLFLPPNGAQVEPLHLPKCLLNTYILRYLQVHRERDSTYFLFTLSLLHKNLSSPEPPFKIYSLFLTMKKMMEFQ